MHVRPKLRPDYSFMYFNRTHGPMQLIHPNFYNLSVQHQMFQLMNLVHLQENYMSVGSQFQESMCADQRKITKALWFLKKNIRI